MKVKNPRNILKYQEKGLAFNKKSLFLVIGIAIYAGIGFLLRFLGIPTTVSFIVAIIPAIPFILATFLQVSGLSFDVIIKRIISAVIYNRDYRPYKVKGVKK